MPATINSMTPSAAAPGDEIQLAATGVVEGAAVVYQADTKAYSDTAWSTGLDGALYSVVPDLFGGAAGALSVTIRNPGEDASNAIPLQVLVSPAVEPIYELCSVAQLKAMAGISASEAWDDAKFRALIQAASAAIAGFSGRSFRATGYVEACDGDGTNLLRLSHTPILAVTDISIDGDAIDPSEVFVYPEYIKFESPDADYNARLRDYERLFPVGTQNITVSYQAGYSLVPAEINQACILQVMYLMNLAVKQGFVSESNQTAQVTNNYSQEPLCPAAKAACNRFRRPQVAVI